MSTSITIRNVPDETHAELVERARRAGVSLQEYLLRELEKLTSKPDIETWLAQVREHKKATHTSLSAEKILAYRDMDRK